MPKDLPPKSTLYDYFDLWTSDGTLVDDRIAYFESKFFGLITHGVNGGAGMLKSIKLKQ